MKKTYMIPDTQCVRIQTVNMIADSLRSMGTTGGVVETNNTELTDQVSDSRRFTLWDDEDEE